MSVRIDNSGIDMVEEDNSNGNASGADASPRRQQHQQLQPQGPQHIRRIFHGPSPPPGFRFAHRHVHPNNVVGRNANENNEGPSGIVNGNTLQNPPLNGHGNVNVNGNSNANRHYVQRLRLNMGGRGPFMVRQQQQRPNPFSQISQQQQQQQQQQLNFHSMGPNGPIHIGPNGPVPVQVRMVQVQVDPLAPQALPASTTAHTSEHATTNELTSTSSARDNQRVEDPPDYERYKCQICYEYLNDPVGCGKCASRFCRACLQRVYESDRQKQQRTKCPVCRCEYDEIVPDHGMYAGSNGERAPALPCRYICSGCPERNLPLSEIAKHEQVCDHVPMRCRYAPYGCCWVGKRGLVEAHEEFGCKLAPMGKLIEQFRQMKADHSMRLEMIGQQASGSVRMSHVLRQTYTRDNQRKSLSDTLRLFQYCHAVTGLTPHFFKTKDLWVSYWRNNESRAAVINFCMCVPFLAAALGVVGRSTSSFFELFEDVSPDRTLAMLARALEEANMNIANITNYTAAEKITSVIHKLQKSQTEELLITTFLGTCVGTLGVLVVMLNYVDTKSNISWDKIKLPYVGGRFPLVGDVMAISIFTLLLSIMEYHQSNIRAAVLWLTIVVTSTFFPALIFSISHYTARLVTRTPRPTTFNLLEMARLVEPCMFGLRFSMAIVYFGVAATLDASVILSLVPQTSRMYLKNSLFDHMPRTVSFAFLVAKSAYWAFRVQNLLFDGDLDLSMLQGWSAVTMESAQKFFTSSPDAAALSSVLDSIFTSILAAASLMVTSCIINNFFALGITVGDYIAFTSQEELSPEGIARGTAKEYSSVGLFAFGSWVMMIALLARI
jgi:hypothetical protein